MRFPAVVSVRIMDSTYSPADTRRRFLAGAAASAAIPVVASLAGAI
jgi:hypothetical protein